MAQHRERSQREPAVRAAISWWELGLVAAFCFGIRLAATLGGGGFVTNGIYDDGVYFTSAALFVHGQWPYADYLLLHPPGMTLLLAPFAALASVTSDTWGYTLARVTVMVIAGTSAAQLTAYAARWGRPAAWVAGLSYALLGGSVYAGSTLFMEGIATAMTLIALGLIRRGPIRWVIAAGLVMGLLPTLKAWNVPIALIVILCAGTWRNRVVAAGAALVSFCAVMVPFLVRAPESMWRMLVSDQLGRPRYEMSALARFANFLGYASGGSSELTVGGASLIVTVAAIVLIAAMIVAAWRAKVGVVLPLFVASMALMALSQLALRNYAELWAPWCALIAGASLKGWGRKRWMVAGGVMVAAAWLVIEAVGAARPVGKPLPTPWLSEQVAAARCVVVDDPVALIALNRLSPQLRSGCPPLWADVSGRTYDYAALGGAPRVENTIWQDVLYGYLTSADAAVTCRANTGISQQTLDRLKPARLGRVAGCSVYVFQKR